MKTQKSGTLRIAVAVFLIAMFSLVGNTYSQTVSSKTLYAERAAINRDLVKISQHNQKVNLLKEECKNKQASEERKAETKVELKTAKADLQNSKTHLRIHKEALVSKHNAIVRENRQALSKERTQLASAKASLFSDMVLAKESAVPNAQAVVNSKKAIDNRKANLNEAKRARNDDIVAINEGLESANTQSPIVLLSEHPYAKTQNVAMK